MYLPSEPAPQPQPGGLLLCYITDRRQFPGGPADQERHLLEKIAECAAAGVDFIQLREKDLSTRRLEELANKAVAALPAGSSTKLLINARADVALACGAHGVHLPANDLPASEVRALMVRVNGRQAVIGVSTHSVEEVSRAEAHGADFAVFGPVFEKYRQEKQGQENQGQAKTPARGLALLRQACRRPLIHGVAMPVLALGGITLENAPLCFAAGAAGIAAIRLFQQNTAELIVRRLRAQW